MRQMLGYNGYQRSTARSSEPSNPWGSMQKLFDVQRSIPGHVPADLVVDFDFYSPAGPHGDPQAAIARLFEGRSPRILYTPRNGGHWVIGGYRELLEAARDTASFSSSSMQIPEMPDEPKFIPLNLDPPEHDAYRKILVSTFSREHVATLEADIRQLLGELIDGVAGQGACDFVEAISEPLPTFVFMAILGMPKARYREFRNAVSMFLTDPEFRMEGMTFIDGEIAKLLAERKRKPESDLLSRMIVSEIDGRPISDTELLGFCQLLIIAGLDTVMNAMSFGVRHLAGDPALQHLLRQDPSRIPEAVEELLRRYSFTNAGRLVARNVNFFGVDVQKGDRVLFVTAGASLDPREFKDPDHFELERKQKILAAFGFGRHRCVGLHLARLELVILYEEWLRRIPAFHLDPQVPPAFHGGVVFGLKSLPLILGKGA